MAWGIASMKNISELIGLVTMSYVKDVLNRWCAKAPEPEDLGCRDKAQILHSGARIFYKGMLLPVS